MLVAVGSRNPVKVEAVRNGLRPIYGELELVAFDVASGVRPQPFGDEETRAGALARAVNALAASGQAAMAVGLEGGVVEIGGAMYACAWCAIVSRAGVTGFASTGRCPLPPRVAELVRGGIELGAADDIVFGRENSRLNEGAVGILTRGHIDRAAFYTPAVTMALAPFLNPEHF
jgi:inosine/xanthosine triphosphatase